MPSITKTQQKNILDHLEPLKVKIKVTPPFKNWFSGVLCAHDVRDIEIEDLLGRDTVSPAPGLIARCITDKTVMVTGAGGSIFGITLALGDAVGSKTNKYKND